MNQDITIEENKVVKKPASTSAKTKTKVSQKRKADFQNSDLPALKLHKKSHRNKKTMSASYYDRHGYIDNRNFDSMEPIHRLELLNDWIGELQEMYAHALGQVSYYGITAKVKERDSFGGYLVPAKFLSRSKDFSQYTEEKIDDLIKNGQWIKGQHYFLGLDGTVYINHGLVYEWDSCICHWNEVYKEHNELL